MRRFPLYLAFWALVLTTLAPFVVWFGPDFEENWFPVLSDQQVTVVRTGDTLTFTVEVTKNRTCRLVEVSYAVVRGIERTPIIVRTLQDAPTTSYPEGRFLLGPFEATLPPYFTDADYIEGTLYYECHAGWLTRQTFGPVPIPPASP